MNAHQAKQLQGMLETACNQHLQQGGEICARAFLSGKARCPISCLVGNCDGTWVKQAIALVKDKLGFEVSEYEMWKVIYSFDALTSDYMTSPDGHDYVSAWLIGKALRAKYLP